MGSSSSVQSSNPGSAEGSENVDFEAPEDIDDHETSTNSGDKVFVLETEVAVAVERVAPKLEKRIPYDKQKQYWGEDNIPYFRQVHYACQCPKGHALVPVVARHAVGFSHLKCVASPRSSKGDLKTNDPPLIRATQNTPQSSDFEWDPLRLVAPRHGEEQESRKQNDLLRSACADGDLDLVTKLLDQGVDVNCQDEKGVTPLHACAFASNLKVAQLLLRRGADQMQGDESEMAPIHYAAAEGALALVGLFVECGGTNVAGLVGIHGITPAHMAAHNGHCDVLSYISQVCGPEYCDQLDSQDHSPLHLASSRGHSECIDVLLQIQMRCQAHLYNFDQMTPSNEDNDNINLAAAGLLLPFTEVFETDESIKSQELVGNCDSAKSLYDGNSTEIVEISLATKLHKAVCCGMISEMRVLLFGGAKVDVYDANGFTPVHYACSKNRLDMVALMLNFGDREALATSLLKHGTTSPLMCAISTNDGPLVHYLVCKFPSWLEVRDSDGVVPVAAALDNSCSLALVRALVIGGADLKAIAKNAPPASRTHAHALKGVQNVNASVYEYASNFDTEAANFVRIVGLDPVVIRPQWCAELARHVVVWSGPNCPAAHRAAFSGRVTELQKLARNRSDFLNERDSAGFTALHAACAGGVLRLVDVLLKFNFVVDASDNDAGLSPLFFAVNGGFPLLVERLMPLVLDASTLYNLQGRSLLAVLPADESASVAISTIIMSIFPFIDDPVENPNVAAHVEQMRTNVQSAASYIVNTDPVSLSDLLTQMPLLIYCRMNSEGHTLLHMACERLEAVMCVELLCRIGAPVEAVMSNGLSALHIAALYKNLAAMKILLSCGASPDLADLNGLTPLHIAVIGTHSEGITLLVKDWHAESNVADFQIDRRYDASSEAAKHFTPKCAVASVLKVPDAGFGQDVAAVACCSEQNTLLCHACSVSTSRSASYGWFECSVENCSNCYALCASCMNILTAKDPPPASPLLKFLGKSKNGINSQTPTMPIVDSSKSGLSFDKKGVRLDFLRAFKSQHSGACSHMTTEQICYLLIKPQTALHRCSVVHQLSRTEQFQNFGQLSNWFVSHAWDSLFFPMIDAILTFFEHRADADKAIIWIDLFCISQHTDPVSPVSPMWWITFSKCIQQAGRMLWVIDSWMKPKPLRRSWCLMEALTILRELSKHRHGLFKIIMCREAYQDMLRAARDTPEEFCSALSELIGSVDVESSECTFEQEKISILKQLEKMGTFDMLNFNISGIVEDWVFDMLKQMTFEIIEEGDEDALFSFRLFLAMVFNERGRLHDALQQMELRLVWKYKLLDQHKEAGSAEISVHTIALADALLDVAESYALLNRFEDTLKFQEEAKKYCQRVLHEDDMRHAEIMACIAQTHLNLEKGKTALQLIGSTLQFHIRVLPQHDPRIFCAEAAVASMHRSMQDFTSALELEKQVLEKRIQNLPLNHPDIGSSHFSIALTLPFIESLAVPERNSRIIENLMNAVSVWKCSLKPDDPRLLQARQKLEKFQELLQQEQEASGTNASW